MATGALPPALTNLPPMAVDPSPPASNVDFDYLLSQILRTDLPPLVAPLAPPLAHMRFVPHQQAPPPMMSWPPPHMRSFVPHQQAPPPSPYMGNFVPHHQSPMIPRPMPPQIGTFVPHPQAPMMAMPPPAQMCTFVPPQQAPMIPRPPAVESKPNRRFTGKRKARQDDDEDDFKAKRQTPPVDIFKIRQIQKALAQQRERIAAAKAQSTSGSLGSGK